MVHLTEKPVELAVRAMQYSSRAGENVLDLFGGSGSTLIAAEQTGRKAFLMELDPLYATSSSSGGRSSPARRPSENPQPPAVEVAEAADDATSVGVSRSSTIGRIAKPRSRARWPRLSGSGDRDAVRRGRRTGWRESVGVQAEIAIARVGKPAVLGDGQEVLGARPDGSC